LKLMKNAWLSSPVLAVLCAIACSTPEAPPGASGGGTPAIGLDSRTAAADQTLPEVVSPYDALPEGARLLLDKPFTGDLDEMIKRRVIRAGVVFNRTQYFIDHGTQRGTVYDSIRLFEEQLNLRMKTGLLKVHVAFVPLSRDQLFPALRDGRVDVVAAALTVTPERQKLADFSNPTRSNVSEIAVTGPDAAALTTPDDLSGREVFVRRSSSYYESLVALNQSLKGRGKAEVTIKEAPEALEDDDLLEMVNAGLVDLTIVDDYVAEFWQQVFTNLRLHRDAAVRRGGEIAVAVRKGNPRMARAVNTWIKEYGPRTAFGNATNRKYLENTTYVKRAMDEAERKKFMTLVQLFQKYGEQYNVDFLLAAAQGYQESRLDHSARSPVGAIGLMQVMPATGKELGVGDITQMEPNIHAGVKYIRFMIDQYYKDEPMDELNKGLMALASYNAGPNRIRQLRKETASRGLDPNRWFGNVERIVSERIGRETVTYVANIYKYYVAYRLILEQRLARDKMKSAVEKQ
jgi:membrane-bound lytic murein transglycosylase MltF